jgi:tRNA pseudouridine38-40 synthase
VRLRLTIEYDGTAFRGWARQPGERTVEGELLRALRTLYPSVEACTRSRTSSR